MIILGCISVMATVIILHVYHYPETKPIPKWARYLIEKRSKGKKNKTGARVTPSNGIRSISLGLWTISAPLYRENDVLSRKNTVEDKVDNEQSTDDWRQLALFFDRVTFIALILGNVGVFLFIIGEYVFGNKTSAYG